MGVSDKIWPILLLYEERGQRQATEDCLRAAGFAEWELADREGVGSMARAFNDAAHWGAPQGQQYLWFLTNVTFSPDVPASLLDALERFPDAAAVHPRMESSHAFINNAKGVQSAHFIEWTAPLVRVSAWAAVGELDEAMPYVHFDLDWSERAKQAGWSLLVDGRVSVGHRYLHLHTPEKISVLRAALRQYRHEASLNALAAKYGHNWKNTLCKGGNCG